MQVSVDELELQADLRTYHRDVPFTGRAVRISAKGKPVAMINYLDGAEHGAQWRLHDNGGTELDGTAHFGRPVGDWRSWYDSGVLREHARFDRDGALRYRRRWDAAGTLVEEFGDA